MPELPEVEVLVRHLSPRLRNKTIRRVTVHRAKVVSPTPIKRLIHALNGAKFVGLSRRGKYLLFQLRKGGSTFSLVGHLGMTGRFYLQPRHSPLPKHTAVCLELVRQNLVYEDQRYFGRLTLDLSPVNKLGPEPLESEFTADYFATALRRSKQTIKVRLLDQSLVAGIGNIYASEALFRAGIRPTHSAQRLEPAQVKKLHQSIRWVLNDAIRCGSTLPLNLSGTGDRNGLFYFGQAEGTGDFYEERLRVYDREGKPCIRCGTDIRRFVQAARSTFYCPQCQT